MWIYSAPTEMFNCLLQLVVNDLKCKIRETGGGEEEKLIKLIINNKHFLIGITFFKLIVYVKFKLLVLKQCPVGPLSSIFWMILKKNKCPLTWKLVITKNGSAHIYLIWMTFKTVKKMIKLIIYLIIFCMY